MFKILDHEAISFTFLHEANLFVEFSGKSNNFITFSAYSTLCKCHPHSMPASANIIPSWIFAKCESRHGSAATLFKKNKLTCTLIFQLNKLHHAAGIFEI